MHRFKNILLVSDAGVDIGPALSRAVALAWSNSGDLTIARVVRPDEVEWLSRLGEAGADIAAGMRAEHETELAALADEAEQLGVRPETRLLWGEPFFTVIQQVLRDGHDLVMKVAEGPVRGLQQRLFGSTDQHLMRKCPCPVWLFRPTQSERFRSVLAAVDVAGADRTKLNARIVQLASSLAVREGAELHVVHAWSLYGESILRSPTRGIGEAPLEALLQDTRRTREERLLELVREEAVPESEPRLHLVKAAAPVGIRHEARRVEADVVVMGTLSRAGVPGFLIGNTAESVLSQLDCSVLTVKPAGFQSPITVEETNTTYAAKAAETAV
jgi:nucleotide-binding universal stress UspA family protein